MRFNRRLTQICADLRSGLVGCREVWDGERWRGGRIGCGRGVCDYDGGGLERGDGLVAIGGQEFRGDFMFGQGFEARDAVDDGVGKLLAVGGGRNKTGLNVAGDEAALDENGGNLSQADDGEAGVFYAAIDLGDIAEERVVDAFGKSEALDIGHIAGLFAEIMKREGIVGGGGFASRSDGVDLEAGGVGIGEGVVEMDRDENAVRSAVCGDRALLERDESVIGAGHEDLDAFCLEELAGAETDIEGKIFFVAEDADGAFVVTAMAGIEDDRVDGA